MTLAGPELSLPGRAGLPDVAGQNTDVHFARVWRLAEESVQMVRQRRADTLAARVDAVEQEKCVL